MKKELLLFQVFLLLVQDTTPVPDFIWSPEKLWNAWAVPLIQIAAVAVLVLLLLAAVYRIAKSATGKS